MSGKPPRMLEGYRILDFTQFVAGPTCTRLFAEMGAEVIKLELAPDGDRVRSGGLKPINPEFKETTQSSYYQQHNHSKLSLAIDLKQPGARELIMSMLPKIDVVVENFAPGVIKRLGFSYEDVKKVNPKIIMCSISMAGQTGPLSDKAGYDYIGQAYAGITDGIGEIFFFRIIRPFCLNITRFSVRNIEAVVFHRLENALPGGIEIGEINSGKNLFSLPAHGLFVGADAARRRQK